jgi:hypothetical protein
MAEESCDTCKFRKGKHCHRYAPRPTVGCAPNPGCTHPTSEIRWPKVHDVKETCWCGDYQREPGT